MERKHSKTLLWTEFSLRLLRVLTGMAKSQYQYANADGEVYRYTTSTSWSNNATVSVLGLSGTYGANSLYKNVVTDEDGNLTIEFKTDRDKLFWFARMMAPMIWILIMYTTSTISLLLLFRL